MSRTWMGRAFSRLPNSLDHRGVSMSHPVEVIAFDVIETLFGTVYLHAAKECGVEPSRVALVAAHAWDTHGAKRAGLGATPGQALPERDGGTGRDRHFVDRGRHSAFGAIRFARVLTIDFDLLRADASAGSGHVAR